MVGSYYTANRQGNGTIPPMQPSPLVASGMAIHNIDGRPIMGGTLMAGGGAGVQSVAGGYGIASMHGYNNAKCSAFPLWFTTNVPYQMGGLKTTTNWMPLTCQPGI